MTSDIIQNSTDSQSKAAKTIVVKLGGSTLQVDANMKALTGQVAKLAEQGHHVIVVHGGGAHITKALQEQGVNSTFIEGLRVTDENTLMAVYAGLGHVNSAIVEELTNLGVVANALHGEPSLFKCEKRLGGKNGQTDLGWVGDIKSTNVKSIALTGGSVSVISPIGWDGDRNRYNINADHAAFAVAIEVPADSLIFVSDVPGVMVKEGEKTTVLPTLDKTTIEKLIEEGTVSGGMIPKLLSCVAAVEAGVQSVSIINGNSPTSLLDCINGGADSGTTVVGEHGGKAEPTNIRALKDATKVAVN